MTTYTDQNLGIRKHKMSGVTIMLQNNAGEGQQKLHGFFKKDNGPLTVQLFFF